MLNLPSFMLMVFITWGIFASLKDMYKEDERAFKLIRLVEQGVLLGLFITYLFYYS